MTNNCPYCDAEPMQNNEHVDYYWKWWCGSGTQRSDKCRFNEAKNQIRDLKEKIDLLSLPCELCGLPVEEQKGCPVCWYCHHKSIRYVQKLEQYLLQAEHALEEMTHIHDDKTFFPVMNRIFTITQNVEYMDEYDPPFDKDAKSSYCRVNESTNESDQKSYTRTLSQEEVKKLYDDPYAPLRTIKKAANPPDSLTIEEINAELRKEARADSWGIDTEGSQFKKHQRKPSTMSVKQLAELEAEKTEEDWSEGSYAFKQLQQNFKEAKKREDIKAAEEDATRMESEGCQLYKG